MGKAVKAAVNALPNYSFQCINKMWSRITILQLDVERTLGV